jgi:hypothetical protein
MRATSSASSITAKPAEPRLVKSDPFPFSHPQWWLWPTKKEADEAAKKLQKYLDDLND